MAKLFRQLELVFLLTSFIILGAHAAPAVTALPGGGVVSAGNAVISQSVGANSASMTINQSSQRAVIDWNSYNVGQNATVTYNQPNSQSSTLNRISDPNVSQIFGQIKSNGEVVLVNPQGVYFSPSASVNVGALVATTNNISNSDYMKGKATYSENGATGSVVNDGKITAGLGRYVALLAPAVRNNGIIIAQMGTVVLAAGNTITLNFNSGNHLASITATPSHINALVENHNAVIAPGGLIILSARAANELVGGVINQGGKVSVSNLALNQVGGRIVIDGDNVNLNNQSQTLAQGNGNGGQVSITGNNIALNAGSTVNTSSTNQGNGGSVYVMSQSHTTVNGSIKSQGGVNGGNGGVVETSSHGSLTIGSQANINVSAQNAQGTNGNWVLDPYNLTIDSTAASVISQALNTGSVTLSVNSTGCSSVGTCSTGAGDLIINSGVVIQKTSGSQSTLNLIADDAVINNGTITGTLLDVNIQAAQVLLNAGSQINANQVSVTSSQSFVSYGSISGMGNNPLINILAGTFDLFGVITANNTQGSAGSITITTTSGNLTLESVSQLTANGSLNGGSITLGANNMGTISSQGYIQTNGGNGLGGTIKLGNSPSINLSNSNLNADGQTGGLISLSSNTGDITIQNSIIQTNGQAGPGGTILISGANSTSLTNNTTINAQGLTQGGTIKIGNDAINKLIPFSAITTLDSTTTLNAQQTDPTNTTNGGYIETSGHTLNLLASINAGRGGMWLLDPYDYTIGSIEAGYIDTAITNGTSITIDVTSSTVTVGTNSISGITSSTGGTITIKSSINNSTGSGSLTLGSAANPAGMIALNASVSLSAGTLTMYAASFSGSSAISAKNIYIYATGSTTLAGTVTYGNGSNTIASSNGVTLIISGNIIGSSALQIGALGYTGVVNPTGLNASSFSGPLTISYGTWLCNGFCFGNISQNAYLTETVNNGGTLQYGGTSGDGYNTSQVTKVLIDGGTYIASSSGFAALNNIPIQVDSGGATFAAPKGETLTIPSVISGSGNITFGTTSLTGTVQLKNQNSMTGIVTVASGTVDAALTGNPSQYGVLGSASTINVNNGGTISVTQVNALEGYTKSINSNQMASITLNNGGALNTSDTSVNIEGDLKLNGGTLTITGSGEFVTNGNIYATVTQTVSVNFRTQNSTSFLAGSGITLTLSGTIRGSNVVTFGSSSYTGTVVLSGANTYSGGTTVSGGTLVAGLSSTSSVTNGPFGTGGVTLNSSGALDVAGYTVANPIYLNGGVITSSTGANGAVTGVVTLLGVASTLTAASGATLTVGSGAITGAYGLTIGSNSATGTVLLSGANTYSGGTTVRGGVLSVSSGSNLSSGTVTLSGGALLDTATSTIGNAITLGTGTDELATTSGNTVTFSGVIGGSGALTVGDSTNTGMVALMNANTYSGGTTINGGVLQASSSTALGTGALTIEAVGKLDLQYAGTVTISSLTMISGAQITNTLYTSNLSVTNSSTLAGSVTTNGSQIYNGAVILAGSTTLIANNNSAIEFGSTVDSESTTAFGLTISNGTGSTIFNNAVGSINPLLFLISSSTGTTILADNIVTNGSIGQTYNNIIIESPLVTLTTNNGPLTVNGNISTENSVLQFLYGGSYIFNGITYSASSTSSTLGLIGSVSWNGTSYTFIPNSNLSAQYLVGGGGGGGAGCGVCQNGGGGGGGGQVLTGTVTIDATPNSISVGAGGVGGLTGESNGNNGTSSTLSTITANGGDGGAGYYNKGYPIPGGSLYQSGGAGGWNTSGNSGAAGIISIITGTTYMYGNGGGGGAGYGYAGSAGYGGQGYPPVSGLGGWNGYYNGHDGTYFGAGGGGGYYTGIGGNGGNGTVVLAVPSNSLTINSGTGTIKIGSSSNLKTLTLISSSNNSSQTSAGVISGNTNLIYSGTGIFTLNGANTYTGNTTVSGGTLQLGSGGSIASTSALVMSGTANLDLYGNNQTFASLTGGASDEIYNSKANTTSTLSVAGGTTTFAGVIKDNTGSGGVVGLTVEGGQLTLSGSNTYTGNTTVSGGTVVVGNNSALGTGAVTLSSGTVLQAGATTIGLSNPIALTGAATINAPSSDTLTLSGAITGGSSTNTLTFSGGGGFVATNAGNQLGTIANSTVSSLDLLNNQSLILNGFTTIGSITAVTTSGNLTLAGNIISGGLLSSNSVLTLKSYQDLIINSGVNIDATQNSNTQPLNVVLWSNASGSSGAVYIQHQDYLFSNGGDIWIGGGSGNASLTTASGSTITVGNGVALGSSNYPFGISIGGTVGENDTSIGGSLVSNGGNITLTGTTQYFSSNVASNQTAEGVALFGGELINSGVGKVYINGVSNVTQSGYTAYSGIELGAWGFPTGINTTNGVSLNSTVITSSNTSSSSSTCTSNAICITGQSIKNSGVSIGHGPDLIYTNSSGGVFINGQGGSNSSYALILSGADILSGSGTITLSGAGASATSPTQLYIQNAYLGSIPGGCTSVYSACTNTQEASSASVDLLADSFVIASGTYINTTGAFKVSPTGTDSFTSNINWDFSNSGNNIVGVSNTTFQNLTIENSSTLGGLIIGSPSNTSNITIASPTSISGPISIYGSNVAIDATLISTGASANGNITINAATVTQGTSDIITTGSFGVLDFIGTSSTSTMTLSQSNALAGLIVDTGIVSISSDSNLSAAPTSSVANWITLTNGGTLESTASSLTLNSNRAITLSAGGGGLAASSADVLTYNGTIIDGGNGYGLTINSGSQTGTVSLGGANTYSGGTTVSGGMLVAGLSSAGSVTNGPFGTGSVTISSSSTLDVAGYTVANPIDLNGGVITSSTGANGAITGGITLGAASTLTAATGDTLTVGAGAITGAHGLTIGSNSATGTVLLSGANTYSGGTTVSGGVLTVSNDSGLGATTGTVQVDSGAILDLQSVAVGANPMTLSGGTVRDTTSSYAGNITLASNSTFSATNASDVLTLSGVVSGTGYGITVSGSGTVALTNANTYTGATIINSGSTLALTGSGSIASSSGVSDGGTLDISGTTSGISITSLSGAGAVSLGANSLTLSNASGTYSGVMSGTGGLTLSSGAETLSGANTYSGGTTVSGGVLSVSSGGVSGSNLSTGAVTLSGGALLDTATSTIGNAITLGTGTDELAATSSNTATFSGVINGGGALTVGDSTNTGTVVLTNTNTYTGATTIATSATLQLNSGGTINTTSGVTDNGTLTYNNVTTNTAQGVTGSGTINVGTSSGTGTTLQLTGALGVTGGVMVYSGNVLDLNGNNSTSALTLSGTGISDGGALINSGSIAATASGAVTLAGNASLGGSGNLTVSGVIGGGSYTLTKVGTDTVVLSGSNTYSGGASVNSGLLVAGNNAALGTGAVTLANGTAMDLNGYSVANTVNVVGLGINNSGVIYNSNANSPASVGGLVLTGDSTISAVNGLSVTGAINGAYGLTLNAGSSNVALNGLVGATTSLTNLTVNSTGNIDIGNSITTSQNQSYKGNVVLNGGNSGSVTTPIVLTSQNGNINFAGTVTTYLNTLTQQQSLTVTANNGSVSFNNQVGAAQSTLYSNYNGAVAITPYQLVVNASTINLNADVTTLNSQTYNGSVILGDNGTNGTTRTFISVDPQVVFNGTINDSVAGTHSLNVSAAALNTTTMPMIEFGGAIGNTAALQSLNIITGNQDTTAGALIGAVMPEAGNSNWNGQIIIAGDITTQGSQTYTAAQMQLGAGGANQTLKITVKGNGKITMNTGPNGIAPVGSALALQININGTGALNNQAQAALGASGLRVSVTSPETSGGHFNAASISSQINVTSPNGLMNSSLNSSGDVTVGGVELVSSNTPISVATENTTDSQVINQNNSVTNQSVTTNTNNFDCGVLVSMDPLEGLPEMGLLTPQNLNQLNGNQVGCR